MARPSATLATSGPTSAPVDVMRASRPLAVTAEVSVLSWAEATETLED